MPRTLASRPAAKIAGWGIISWRWVLASAGLIFELRKALAKAQHHETASMIKCVISPYLAAAAGADTGGFALGSPVAGGAWSSFAGGPSSSVKTGFSASAQTW